MLFWREIGAITLAQNWAYTELTNSNLFRITHQIDNQPPDALRAVIGQETEDIVFDRRLMGYKLGAVEGQLIVMPEGVSERRLAVQRLDRVVGTNWTIKIEELIDLAINLPLPISEVEGLEAELAEKAIASEVESALEQKAPTIHNHDISSINGLESALEQKAITSEVESALLDKAPTVHGHQISDVTGLEVELSEKAIASEVEAALAGKAPTVHGHQISDVTGLEAELAEKAIASEVEAALLAKAPTVHGHGISDVTGLGAELAEKAIASEVVIALAGKAATVHGHAIGDVTGLQTALNEKAIASEVITALAGKAAIVHGHEPAEITGLTELIESLQPRSNVVTSSTMPLDPFPGLIWHEMNTNNLVESWVFLNNEWLSITKHSVPLAAPNSTIGATANYVIPIDFRYDYLFSEVILHCDYNTSTMNATNNWQLILSTQSAGSVIFNSEAILEDNISKIFEINSLHSFNAGERINILFQKNGTAPNIRMGVLLNYRLVRK
ncbi:hypothetical protein [Calothrix sp. PCC 6303]|uniref:hypothetical protein n=1 Tax=Calothrix sp. PCC 6303 TaxID=1170562 RepID=UPI0002A01D81|nr:hypothetical protein [Calothrix sp. PCC 6303]AFZ01627.1 hypothetical protein Cal6303_2654 [Calothrix sp. PCC 6303]